MDTTSINCYLVIGGCGFVGAALVTKLLSVSPHAKVYVLDNFSTSYDSPIAKVFLEHPEDTTYIANDRLVYFKGNSWEVSTWCSQINPDVVFHFGEFSRINQSWKETEKCMQSNLYGTTCVLEYCVKKRSMLVYSASSAILSASGATEDAASATPYTWSKAKMVELVKLYQKWYGLQYLITYFYNVYGPGQITTGPYATVIGRFVHQASNGKSLTVVEPGTQMRCFTHIDDIISGIVFGLQHLANGTEFPISSPDEISIIQLAQTIKQLCLHTVNIQLTASERGNRQTSAKTLPDRLRALGWDTHHELMKYLRDEVKGG